MYGELEDVKKMLSFEIQQYYAEHYYSYTIDKIKHRESFQEDKRLVGDFLMKHTQPGFKMLDIGAGNCQWFDIISGKVSTYFALDSCYDLCNSDYFKKNPKLEYFTGNAFEIDYPVIFGKVDTVILSFLLSHFNNETIIRLFNKLKEVSKTIIVIDSYEDSPDNALASLTSIERKTPSPDRRISLPKRLFRHDELIQLAIKSGFQPKDKKAGKYWLALLLDAKD